MGSQRRLAAIMFTDLAGSTASAQADEAGALRRLKEQEGLLRPAFREFGGREVKSTGDGFLVEFGSSLDAAKCSIEIQRRLHRRNAAQPKDPILIRIGIHLGDVEQRGGDIFGDAVNIAARVEPFAEPGSVCISEQVFSQVKNKLPERIDSLGPTALRGVSEPVGLYRIAFIDNGPEPSDGRSQPRLAVLPLSNISPDAADEFFADGMTEELISTLSKIPGLDVISRTSVMPYKGRSKGVPEIGRELKVGSLIEGSVRKAGTRIRITVQLIEVATDRHLWAETYDRTLDDVFAVQAEIAGKVARSLRLQLLDRDDTGPGQWPTTDPGAHLLYLRARFEFDRVTRAGALAARALLEEATQKDPQYAVAFAERARVEDLIGFFGWAPVTETLPRQKAFAERALALDESLSPAHVALSDALLASWDFEGTIREAERAVALDPNDASARSNLAVKCLMFRQLDRARAELEVALRLAPDDLRVQEECATWLLYSDRASRAASLFEQIVARNPTKVFSMNNLGLAHVRMGEVRRGLAEIEEACHSDATYDMGRHADLAYALSLDGQTDRARQVVETMERECEKQHFGAGWVASAWGGIGETEKALQWLDRSYEEHSPNMGVFLGMDFGMERLRSDPRFEAFLKRIGHPGMSGGARA